MAVLGIVWIVFVPYFLGALILGILRERKAGNLERFVTGFLSLFMFFFFCLLVTVKFDLGLEMLGRIFIIPVTVFSLFGIYFGVKDFAGTRKSNCDIILISAALILATVSFGILSPSYVNDDTFEIVATTLSTNTIYEYSAMTGERMINGLPIFNKIYMMPLFFSVMCGVFKIPMSFLGGVIFPCVVFFTCIGLAYRISLILNVKNRRYFVLLYMLILIVGTYLPIKGIPVTAGYAVLREGYSGYAVAYGIVVPFACLLLLKRKYLWAVVSLFPALGMIRLDRIVFALANPVEAYLEINTSGKLIFLYFAAVLFSVFMLFMKERKILWQLLFAPGLFASYCFEEALAILKEKKNRIVCVVGTVTVILFCCNYQPFSDASLRLTEARFEKQVESTLNDIEIGAKVWAPEDFSYAARRIRGDIKTLFGRDDYSSYMTGLDYENKTDYTDDFHDEIRNLARGQVFYPFEHDEPEVFQKAVQEGAKYIILPDGNGYRVYPADNYMEDIINEEWTPWRYK